MLLTILYAISGEGYLNFELNYLLKRYKMFHLVSLMVNSKTSDLI